MNTPMSKYGSGKQTIQYPVETEKALRDAVYKKTREEAQSQLRALLQFLFYHSSWDLGQVKIRLHELLALISRASGYFHTDREKVFSINEHYFYELEKYDTVSELTITMANAVSRYISGDNDFAGVNTTDVINKAVIYIKNNYHRKISLSDVASHVHLSNSYLCKMFKASMGINLSNYINTIKIEKSKELMLTGQYDLSDIIKHVGYEDQSYFTKVFKRHTGMSPSQYRKSMLGLGLKK